MTQREARAIALSRVNAMFPVNDVGSIVSSRRGGKRLDDKT